jgi:hypothetical protein
MIKQSARITSRRQVVLVVFSITAFSVLLSAGTTALVMAGMPLDEPVNGLSIAVLIPLVVAPISSYRIVDALRTIADLKESVERLAGTDELTNRNNLRAFPAEADIAIKRARQLGASLCVCSSILVISSVLTVRSVTSLGTRSWLRSRTSCRNRFAPASILLAGSVAKNLHYCEQILRMVRLLRSRFDPPSSRPESTPLWLRLG